MNLSVPCPECNEVIQTEIPAKKSGEDKPDIAIHCSSCAWKTELDVSESIQKDSLIDRCPVCDCEEFYIQNDLSQKIGCAIVIVGAIFVPWTYGLSLGVVALIDFILYKFLPRVTLCYRCKTIFRGFKKNPNHLAFEMSTEEKYRMIKRAAREEGKTTTQ